MTLCAPQVTWKALCCVCNVLPFHSFALLTLSVSPIYIRESKFVMCAQRRQTERKLENTRAICTHSLDVALGVSERGI